jgi:hypothetical protein
MVLKKKEEKIARNALIPQQIFFKYFFFSYLD